MRKAFVAGALCVQFFLLFVSLALGQGARGTINGSVTDPSGALISGAQVTIKNTLTGQVTTVNTTADGNYNAPFLQIGKYEVTATHEGFETETKINITLTADQVASVNFMLKVGATSTKVEVVATGTQIDTTTGAVGEVIDQKAISELPLNGRNPAELVFVAPGSINGSFTTAIALPGSGSGFPQETAASVNGSRMGGVSYQLDGITHMNNYFQTASPFPNPEATQEFRVITNNFDAQYGYTSGAIVSIATKSGTNQWHGGVFEFLRNNVLNSKEYFTQQADPLKRNQFGGYMGGPIIKDKLFVFGNVQVTRERVAQSFGGVRVPNNNELAGDFGQFCTVVYGSTFDANGLCNNRAGQLYKSYSDHTDANAYMNNQIDPSNFVPFSTNLETGIPKTDDPLGNIILKGRSQKNDGYEYTLRTDYNISATQTLTGRIFYDNFNRPPYNDPSNYIAGDRSNQAQSVNISINHTWTIRPNMVNDLRGGFNRNNSQTVNGIQVSPSTLGANLPSLSKTIGLVQTNGFSISQIPVQQARHNWIFDDTLSITKGRHSIVAGVSSFTQYGFENATWEADPLIWFNGSVTGNADADFLLGDAQEVATAAGEYNKYSAWNWAAFGQDSIKLKPNLNVNLGVRWEPQIAPVSEQNKLANYWPGYQSTRFPLAPQGMAFGGDPGVPAGGWANQWATFLPRVSVAWSPKALPNTSIRSAFAYMAPPYDYSFYNWQGHNAPFSPEYDMFFNQVDPGCVLNVMNPFLCFSPTNHVDPFPPFAGPGFNPGADATIVLPTNVKAGFDRGFVSAREETWNLSIQHSMGNDLLFGATYIGRHDFHLPTSSEMNPGTFVCGPVGPNCTQAQFDSNGARPLADYVLVQQYHSIGVASYHAIQFTVDKRFSHGLQFTSNFTYSRNLDEQAMASISNVGDGLYNPLSYRDNYGVSDLNIPRIWNNTFVYQVPKLGNLGKAGSYLLGSWEIAGVWVLHSGRPFSVNGGNNPDAATGGENNASYSQVGLDLADLVPGQSFKVHQGSKSQWLNQYFNTAAFTYNAIGTFGDSGRNIMQGPGWNNADLMFAKNFPFRERYNIQFRWEMFNALNRTEFSAPDSQFSDPNIGRITSTSAPPRLMQAGLKFSF